MSPRRSSSTPSPAPTRSVERARAAGAVNALKFEDGRVLAENFDGVGLVRDIEVNLGVGLAGVACCCWAPAAPRAAPRPAILARGPARLTIANRDVEKAAELARTLRAARARSTPAATPISSHGGLTTSCSTRPRRAGAARRCRRRGPASPQGALAYELVYGKGLTPFLAARARGRGGPARRRRRHVGRAGRRSVRLVARRAAGNRRGHRGVDDSPDLRRLRWRSRSL